MGKIVIGILILFLLIGASTGAIVYSLKNDLETMQNQNILFLIVDETSNNEIEVGLGSAVTERGRENFLVNAEKINSEPMHVVGSEINGIFGTGENELYTKSVVIHRVVVIQAVVLEKIVDTIGGIDVKLEVSKEVSVSKHLTGEEVANLLRGENLAGTGTWEVTFLNPLTHALETRRLEGEEVYNFIIEKIPPDKPWLIKIGMLKWTVDSIMEKTEGNKELTAKILESAFNSYKTGAIQTYPSNTLTKIIKIIPVGLIKDRILTK
jgi:hypothetical protein